MWHVARNLDKLTTPPNYTTFYVACTHLVYPRLLLLVLGISASPCQGLVAKCAQFNLQPMDKRKLDDVEKRVSPIDLLTEW